MHGMNQVAKGAKFLDTAALTKAYKSALKRHHGIVAEANFIIDFILRGENLMDMLVAETIMRQIHCGVDAHGNTGRQMMMCWGAEEFKGSADESQEGERYLSFKGKRILV